MKLESHLPRQSPWLFIAPLLNVVLLLLVYFLFSSGFVIQSGVSVTLPKSSSRLTGFDRAHIITIAPGDDLPLYYDGRRVTLATLREALERDKKTDRRAIIHFDASVSGGRVMQVSDVALAAGFDIAFATVPPEPPAAR
jgi:biopolymer transport protein ExbD